MSEFVPPSALLPCVAVILGALLSGTMFGHGLAVPVILDTNKSAAHLAAQWQRNFHYGHLIMPEISLACCGMYAVAAVKRSNVASSTTWPLWKLYATAGIVTAGIIPFTLIFMMKTNNVLQKWHQEFKAGNEKSLASEGEVATYKQVRDEVARWGYMHCVRSLIPLAASFVGLMTLLQEVKAA